MVNQEQNLGRKQTCLWKPRWQRSVLLLSCGWQKKMGNRLYYWSRLVQTHDKLIARFLSNASRGSNGSEPVCLDKFSALIG